MAQFGIHGSWKSVVALASLFAFILLLAYVMVGGGPTTPEEAKVSFRMGATLYVLALAVIVFGFWSKEDVIAISGIIGINLLLILDILLRVGLLSFNLADN